MSTLRVTTIQDESGSNASTAEEINKGRAKAWVNFDGTGTVAIRAQFNVSSITDNGTGDYTINFTTALADANYSVAGSSGTVLSDYRIVVPNFNAAPTAAACRIRSAAPSSSGPTTDDNYINVSVFR